MTTLDLTWVMSSMSWPIPVKGPGAVVLIPGL